MLFGHGNTRPKVLQIAGSVLFTVYIYLSIFVFGILGLPFCLYSRAGAYSVMKLYTRILLYVLRILCGIRVVIEGSAHKAIGKYPVVIASKHQSFLDVIVLMHVLPRAKFIMKRELLFTPLFGLYAWRTGAVTVRRSGGNKNKIPALLDAVQTSIDKEAGQIVIYPQGTRVPPGRASAAYPYKRGVAVLYDTLDIPCIPVATNVGYFWGKNQLVKRSGTAVVSFLGSIPPGLPRKQFLLELESKIEKASDNLYQQALAQTKRRKTI